MISTIQDNQQRTVWSRDSPTCSCIVLKSETIGHTSRDGIYVLQCPSEFNPNGIVARVTIIKGVSGVNARIANDEMNVAPTEPRLVENL